MNRNWINTFISFFVLFLLQVFLFNQIDLGIYGSIYAYILFILMLPAEFSALSVLLLSASMGLSIDLSSDSLGLHLSACSLIGYLRPFVLKRFTSPTDTQIEVPTIGRSPFSEFITYTLILVVVHHLLYFTLEAFDFSQIPYILIRTVVSATLTTIVICILSLVMKRFN